MATPLITPYTNSGQGGSIINPYLPQSQVAFQFWQKPVYTASDGSLWCPGFEGKTYADSPWDYLYIATGSTKTFTPGICRVRSRKERRMDKKKPVGSDGARVTLYGIDAAEFDVEIKIWTPDQLKALATLWPVLFPQFNKGSPPSFEVQHPLFSIHNIKAAQFVGGEGPDIQPDRSGIFRMRAVEFLKPSKKNMTKTESGSVAPLPNLLDPGAYPKPGSNTADLGPR